MTGPASRKRAYHHGDLARALVDAALERIATDGVEGFNLREAARAVGVTHAAAYRHFEDKRAILATIAEEGFRALGDEIESALARTEGDAIAKLEALGRAYVRYALREPARFRVMFGPRLNEDGRFPSLEREVRRAFELLLRAIEAGQREGTLREGAPRDLAGALWTSAHGFASLVLHDKIPVRSAARAEGYFVEIARPLFDGLRRA